MTDNKPVGTKNENTVTKVNSVPPEAPGMGIKALTIATKAVKEITSIIFDASKWIFSASITKYGIE